MPKPKTGWIWKMAQRDGWASRGKLVLFVLAIVMGIAAVVAIQSLGYSVKASVNDQSRAILGADYVIDTNYKPDDSLQHILDSLPGKKAASCQFVSMVRFPKQNQSRLVQVNALKGQFPFYGKMETEPISAAQNFLAQGQALVDATLMLQFGVQPGDTVKVGEVFFQIAGSLRSVPGQSAVSASFAPPVYIPFDQLESTGLLQKGSRVEYEYYFTTVPGQELSQLSEELDPKLDAYRADLDTHEEIGQRVSRSYENFGKFLQVVAFIALLLGCIGVASAVNIYVKDKLKSVAILRCLGTTRRQAFFIYLAQMTWVGLGGAIIGTALGLLIQEALPGLIQSFFPISFQISYSWQIIATGIALGTFISVLFALLPLLKIWDVSPLAALRSDQSVSEKAKWRNWVIYSIIFLLLSGFSWWQLGRLSLALGFTGAIALIFVVLSITGWLFMISLRKFFPKNSSYPFRQGLANLFRPNNQTVILILAIGMGAFLISMLFFTRDMLLEKINFESNQDDPNLIIFDVQTNQLSELIATIEDRELPVISSVPIVTMRLAGIKGRTVSEIRNDTTTYIRNWILNREYRVTFRDSLTDSETVMKGEFDGSYSEGDYAIYISLEKGIAHDMKVGLGDKVSFNVQGVPMTTRVGSIREVDWQRIQTNFLVLFPEGVLEDAPQFHVVTTRVPDNATAAAIQQELVTQFPNVSIIDLRQLIVKVEEILAKISTVITFMAFFSIFTGFIVLIGAVRISKFQRISEAVILRTLGAQKKQVFTINAVEYTLLGTLAGLAGIVMALLASQGLAVFVFDLTYIPRLWPAFLILLTVTVFTVATGLFNSRVVVQRTPLEVLRREN